MIFVITEDGYSYKNGIKTPGSGLRFWEEISECLFSLNGTNITVKSSEGNSTFIEVLESLYNLDDIFILSLDNARDNQIVLSIINNVDDFTLNKANIIRLNFVCFEHLLATFKKLPIWTGLDNKKRQDFEIFMTYFNLKQYDESFTEAYDVIEQYCRKYNIKYPNLDEKLIKAVIADICKGINYFNIGKGTDTIGKCWFCNCCIHTGLVYEHSKCELKENKLTKMGKILEIIQNTELENYLEQAGIKIEPLEYEVTAYLLRSLIDTGGVYNDSNP